MSNSPNEQQPASMIFCTNCGTQQSVDQKFCAKCGAPLQQTTTTSTSEPVIPQAPPQVSKTSCSNQFWSWFRRQGTVVQVLGWLFFYWLLIPVLIWRAPWPKSVRIGILIVLAVFIFSAGRTNSSSRQQQNVVSSNTTSTQGAVALAPTGEAQGKATDVPLPTATVKPTALPTVKPTKVVEPSPVPPTPEPTKEILPKIGDQVDVDEVSWRIEDAIDAGDTIESDNRFIDPVVTAGKFVRVRVAIQNQGSEQRHVSNRNLEIVDDQGRTYKGSDDFNLAMIIGSDNACTFQELPAGVPKLCRLVFEVPKDAKGFRFKATNLALIFTEEKMIDLGF